MSEKEASELGMSDILHNLKNRKLTLVVDLDQVLAPSTMWITHEIVTDLVKYHVAHLAQMLLVKYEFKRESM